VELCASEIGPKTDYGPHSPTSSTYVRVEALRGCFVTFTNCWRRFQGKLVPAPLANARGSTFPVPSAPGRKGHFGLCGSICVGLSACTRFQKVPKVRDTSAFAYEVAGSIRGVRTPLSPSQLCNVNVPNSINASMG